MTRIIHYYVEGECEEKLINTLKHPKVNCLEAGKVEKFNVVQNFLSVQRIATLTSDTHIVFVYDVDTDSSDILDKNVKLLKNYGFKNIHHIHSIKNFEEELVYCSSIKNVKEIFDTKSISEFKTKFIRHSDLNKKLNEIEFDANKLWSRKVTNGPFSKYKTDSGLKLIKIRKNK